MTFIILMGIVIIAFVILKREKISESSNFDIPFIRLISKQTWFSNPWLSGIFLFFVNVVLFGATALLLLVLTKFTVPFLHILIMVAAVAISILAWKTISRSWHGTKKDRIKMGVVGSSFYLFLTLWIAYEWFNLKPKFPGDDTFMAAVGLTFGFIVTIVAFITCLSFSLSSNKFTNR
ncbi:MULTISPECIES: hypothetical protein [unclassified Bacillus (in: firmicutes)]|uniref:hypothetical protein n=1 Tax=unclassified Bacillus (in: firmicutes) TaxID=185979 RepID=UPI0008E324AC|nr:MULTISPECIES: hypothetical protein [unclassified Bacillus (in: firmicutes)]SFA71181.1 hypothetical protein SAMN02799634_101188 [Bacillus sp. UNCCL13]SFQ61307.1 hypothetical protein SAMN04488577_0469 [Bacillus sp. cl95]